MPSLLLSSASGLRHLRWAREILATLEVHFEHDARLTQPERDLVLEEMIELRAAIQGLSQHVKAYRDFLERERTRFRGMKRVGRYLTRTATTPEERAEAAAVSQGFDEVCASMEARERAPRKQALREGIGDLREALEAMNGRLRARLPEVFVESLYPDLAREGTHVADDGDEDDDAAAVAP